MSSLQSKYKTLIAIIGLLLITNIAVLVYFMSSHKKPPRTTDKRRGGFENVLKKEVGFNDDQVKQFRALRETHWAEAKRQMDQMKQLKLNMFNLTKEANVPDSVINKMADSIATLQKQIEINSFRHFRGTRQICKPGQQPAYDSLMTKFITRMGRGGKPDKEKNN